MSFGRRKDSQSIHKLDRPVDHRPTLERRFSKLIRSGEIEIADLDFFRVIWELGYGTSFSIKLLSIGPPKSS